MLPPGAGKRPAHKAPPTMHSEGMTFKGEYVEKATKDESQLTPQGSPCLLSKKLLISPQVKRKFKSLTESVQQNKPSSVSASPEHNSSQRSPQRPPRLPSQKLLISPHVKRQFKSITESPKFKKHSSVFETLEQGIQRNLTISPKSQHQENSSPCSSSSSSSRCSSSTIQKWDGSMHSPKVEEGLNKLRKLMRKSRESGDTPPSPSGSCSSSSYEEAGAASEGMWRGPPKASQLAPSMGQSSTPPPAGSDFVNPNKDNSANRIINSPSRSIEGNQVTLNKDYLDALSKQSRLSRLENPSTPPSGDYGNLEAETGIMEKKACDDSTTPSGDYGNLEAETDSMEKKACDDSKTPSGDYGNLEAETGTMGNKACDDSTPPSGDYGNLEAETGTMENKACDDSTPPSGDYGNLAAESHSMENTGCDDWTLQLDGVSDNEMDVDGHACEEEEEEEEADHDSPPHNMGASPGRQQTKPGENYEGDNEMDVDDCEKEDGQNLERDAEVTPRRLVSQPEKIFEGEYLVPLI